MSPQAVATNVKWKIGRLANAWTKAAHGPPRSLVCSGDHAIRGADVPERIRVDVQQEYEEGLLQTRAQHVLSRCAAVLNIGRRWGTPPGNAQLPGGLELWFHARRQCVVPSR